MKILDATLIERAHKKHPGAENDIEALDLYAQGIYKELQVEMDKPGFIQSKSIEDKIDLYHILVALRQQLLQDEIEKQSKSEVVNGQK